MKKTTIIVLTTIILLNLNSCTGGDLEHHGIMDALKISVHLFDENTDMSVPVSWHADTSVSLELLQMDEVRVAPVGGVGGNWHGIAIYVEFDGIIEIVAEDENVLLSRNNNLTPHHIGEHTGITGRIAGFSVSLPFEGFITAIPFYLGRFR